jgi:adenylate cyclase
MEKARQHMAQALKLIPSYSSLLVRKITRYKNPAHLERMLTALRKAGLPEGTPPLPKKPSIAVMPFRNVSGDREQGYFAEGMRDELITGLSKVSGLIVAPRTPPSIHKNKQLPLIARALGVRYVLEGSVRRDGPRVRIDARLGDASANRNVWAETFDREYKAIFALQSELKQKIVQALKVKLTPKERQTIKRKPTDNLKAYDLYLKAERLRLTFHVDSYEEALALYDKALKLDPNFIDAHVGNARASFRIWRHSWGLILSASKAKVRAQRSLAKALALDPDNAQALGLQAFIQINFENYDVALSVARLAVARHPEDPNLRAVFVRVLLASGRLDEARDASRRAGALAHRLSPNQLSELAFDYLMLGDAGRAVPLLLRARKLGSNGIVEAVLLTNSYAQLGKIQKAKAELETVRKYWSWPNVGYFRGSLAYFRNKPLLEKFLSAYRKAGMPE